LDELELLELELDEDELELDELELDELELDELELEFELELDELDDLDELPGEAVTFTVNTRLPNPIHFTSKKTAPALRVIVSPMSVNTCRPPWASSASHTNDPVSLAIWKLTKLTTTYAVVPGSPV
jgi:hypothetical protein